MDTWKRDSPSNEPSPHVLCRLVVQLILVRSSFLTFEEQLRIFIDIADDFKIGFSIQAIFYEAVIIIRPNDLMWLVPVPICLDNIPLVYLPPSLVLEAGVLHQFYFVKFPGY